MYHLVIALFKLLVNVDVLDVKTCIVLEPLLLRPVSAVLELSLWGLLSRNMFDLDLFLDVVHSVRPLQIKCSRVRRALTRETS
jgi:hypothetical protein